MQLAHPISRLKMPAAGKAWISFRIARRELHRWATARGLGDLEVCVPGDAFAAGVSKSFFQAPASSSASRAASLDAARGAALCAQLCQLSLGTCAGLRHCVRICWQNSGSTCLNCSRNILYSLICVMATNQGTRLPRHPSMEARDLNTPGLSEE